MVPLVPADERRDEILVADLRVDLLEVTLDADQPHLTRLIACQQLVVAPREPHDVWGLRRLDDLDARIHRHDLRPELAGLHLRAWRHWDSD